MSKWKKPLIGNEDDEYVPSVSSADDSGSEDKLGEAK